MTDDSGSVKKLLSGSHQSGFDVFLCVETENLHIQPKLDRLEIV